MYNSDDSLGQYSSFESQGADDGGSPYAGYLGEQPVEVPRSSTCLDLAHEVAKMPEADLRSRHVSRIIQNTLQRIVDATVWLKDTPVRCPFVEAQVPYLDFFTGDVRVRLNGLLRRYELHSGPPHPSDRLLTRTEFSDLIYWVDYIIDLGNSLSYSEVPHVLACLDTWLQTLYDTPTLGDE